MLSYRHTYHAGNHADLLKHLVLRQVLDYVGQKDAPFMYLDTHAGAGQYRLDSDFALKNREFDHGVQRLWDQADDSRLPSELLAYLQMLRAFNGGSEQLTRYPGSPAVAASVLRPYDRMVLCELHNREVELLQTYAKPDRRMRVCHEDGVQTMLSLLPPPERRAVVMLDPSYEIKNDYKDLPDRLFKAWKKFSQGVFLIWYPLLPGQPGERMCDAICRSGIRHVQQFELQPFARSEPGMAGSGMLVINPPWLLMEQMQRSLPVAADLIGAQKGAAKWKAEVRVVQ